MRTVAKLALTVAALVMALGVAAGPAVAAVSPDSAQQGAAVVLRADSTPTDDGTASDTDGNINQQRKDADQAKSQTKLILGVAAAVLLVIVYFGHRQRAKSRIRKKNLQHAKS